MKIIIVDVDGTVALMEKGQIGRRSPFDWHRVFEDSPNIPVIELVCMLRTAGYQIMWISGRSAECRHQTERWLAIHCGATDDEPLHMRATGDYRIDADVKRDLYDHHIRDHHEVAWVIDDRDQVVAMWRSLGLTVLQVTPDF